MIADDLMDDMEELSSAEDFLEYFAVPYDPQVVHVNRLHILQRFHDYIAQKGEARGQGAEETRRAYAQALSRAYHDFVVSTARQEKVFKVFRMNEPQKTFVSAADLLGPQ